MNDRTEIQVEKYFQRPFFKPGVGNFKIWKLKFSVTETKFSMLAQPYVHLQAEETKRFDLHIIQLKQWAIVTPPLGNYKIKYFQGVYFFFLRWLWQLG